MAPNECDWEQPGVAHGILPADLTHVSRHVSCVAPCLDTRLGNRRHDVIKFPAPKRASYLQASATVEASAFIFLLPQQFAGTCRDTSFAALQGSAAEQWCAFPDPAGKRGWRARGERAEWFLEEDHTWEKFPFAALLPRDVFAEVARAARGLLLRKARMASLHRRRFSSALAHDSNLAEGFFVALIAALRCFRSAIALSVAVFFIQRVNKHRSQQTATGIPPAPRRRQINAVRQTNGPRRFPQRSKGLDPK